MEAPLHQFPVPLSLPQDALLQQQAVAARALLLAAAGTKAPPSSLAAAAAAVPGPGREQCPRCASRDTKFCYYNNYNTAQPRHFCRACRRYWTLGGSLRNVPVGGATRKRQRPARHTRAAMAAAVAATATPATATTTNASAGGGTFASPATLQGGLLLSSLLLGSVSAAPLLALGAAPLLEGRLGFDDLGLGEAAAALGAAGGGAAAADMAHHQTLPLGAGPLPWPTATATILEGDRAETTAWKTAASTSSVFPFPPAAALWQEQELAAAAPVVEARGLLHHGAAPHLLL